MAASSKFRLSDFAIDFTLDTHNKLIRNLTSCVSLSVLFYVARFIQIKKQP